MTNSSSKHSFLDGSVIGAVVVSEARKVRNQHYETAAWFKEITVPVGAVCDALYHEDGYGKPYVELLYEGPITDEYFGTLWGGKRVGEYKPQRLGEIDIIGTRENFIDFVTNKGAGYAVKGLRFLPAPSIYHDLLRAADDRAREDLKWQHERLNRTHYAVTAPLAKPERVQASGLDGIGRYYTEAAARFTTVAHQRAKANEWLERITLAWEEVHNGVTPA